METLGRLLDQYESPLQQAMKSLGEVRQYESAFHNAMKSLGEIGKYDTHFQQAMKSLGEIGKYEKSIQRSIALLGSGGTNYEWSLINRTIQSLSRIETLKDVIGQISNLPNVIESGIDFPHDDNEKDEIRRAFAKIPKYLQKIILFIVFCMLIPVMQNVFANLITPYVEEIIGASERPKREIIKDIASSRIDNIDLSGLRFVTTETLYLREEPSTKSEILESLRLGQVLVVVSRKRNWIEVSCNYDAGKTLQGWVFARYTAKFQP